MIKTLALYLPQFHPIPENDEWWGKGFTEWTNVAKAKPLYRRHWQPRLPADLGFYDLRVPEVRERQAALAGEYGIHGFCYWHYWFAGRRIIERPFTEVVGSKKPDFPFCIAWANQTWSGTWHGLSNKKVLIEQTYPGREDFTAHFYAMLPAFADDRYITVNGKKLVFVFRPMDMPSPALFTETWQSLGLKEGLTGFHFVGMHMPADWAFSEFGYGGLTEPGPQLHKYRKAGFMDKVFHGLINVDYQKWKRKSANLPLVVPYEQYVKQYPHHATGAHEMPLIYPNWDNTPRSGADGWLFEGSSPELFATLVKKALHETANKAAEEKIVLVKSWNEWAEGNYLEPDGRFGIQYLAALKSAVNEYAVANTLS